MAGVCALQSLLLAIVLLVATADYLFVLLQEFVTHFNDVLSPTSNRRDLSDFALCPIQASHPARLPS